MSHPHLRKRLIHATLTVALCLSLGTGTVLAASPAFASSKLCGGSCSGKDPNTHGCIGNTDFSYTPGGQSIQLRSSANCGAWWARGIRDDCYYPIYIYILVQQQVGSPYGDGYYDVNDQYAEMSSNCNGGTAWTPMVDAHSSGYRERACLLYSPSGPAESENYFARR